METEFKFDPDDYIRKLTEFMFSDSDDSANQIHELVEKVWSLPSETNFHSEAYSTDCSTSSSKLGSSLIGAKRISGTQRLSNFPGIKKPTEVDIIAKPGTTLTVPPLPKKAKKVVPVIDDSITGTSDQPCKTCNGVSMAANMVLSCNGCKESYHMKCNQPPITPEEASNARFIFLCTSCQNPRHMTKPSSRSSSPLTKAEVPEKKFKKLDKKVFNESLEEFKKKKQIKQSPIKPSGN
ncbi:unnamed protein product [Caenorhabditis bovis]|uniref:PHD-type domain-containing protein n=1 Tax=Caenorhabditis bovis TaxID=2654633 RepID=A0A8S1EC51_9PELO|nr:unnamed protein product [Caenorhabditis bovis]